VGARLSRQREGPGKKGGEAVGPNPTDRGKPGTKRHLITDAQGIPLASLLSGANAHDNPFLPALLDTVPSLRTPRGGRRRRPAKLHADKAYDHRNSRAELRRRHIRSRIARRGIDAGTRLGRHRWVIERTFAWLARYRRLTVRDERRADMHQAFLTLACSLICQRFLERTF